jgi:hypothetical protein
MRRFVSGGGDHFRVIGPKLIGQMCVKFDTRLLTVVQVHQSANFAATASAKELSVRGRSCAASPVIRQGLAMLLSRCTIIPDSRLFVFNAFLGFKYKSTALKSRTAALKPRTNFHVNFVPDLDTKVWQHSPLTASILARFKVTRFVRDLSAMNLPQY